MKETKLYLIIIILISIFLAGCDLESKKEFLDAVELDPENYKVEFENEKVRVLRIKYAPGAKSVMHDHPEGVVVTLNNQKGKFTNPDGESFTANIKAGPVFWSDATRHLPENIGNDTTDVIQIEFKN